MAYQKSRELLLILCSISATFPKSEQHGLTSQLRRAALSVCCNLAEGSGKISKKDQNRFIGIAYGSLMEKLNLVFLSSDLQYIDKNKKLNIEMKITEISKMLSGMRRANLRS